MLVAKNMNMVLVCQLLVVLLLGKWKLARVWLVFQLLVQQKLVSMYRNMV